MSSINNVVLQGRLTNDPKFTELANDNAVTNFTLALNRVWKTDGEKQEETTFIDCTAFGGGAKVLNQYVKKGDKLSVVGRLRQSQWQDKESGENRYKVYVHVDDFELGANKQNDNAEPQEEKNKVQKTNKAPVGKTSKVPF